MTERGILFTPENYDKTECGLKMQTRRLAGLEYVNEAPTAWEFVSMIEERKPFHNRATVLFKNKHGAEPRVIKCPFGTVGDRLYVKEAWAADRCYDHLKPIEIPKSAPFYYTNGVGKVFTRGYHKVRSPLFMLKRAARLWLELTAVRVERLHHISELDCEAELGAKPYSLGNGAYAAFKALWESNKIHKPGSWELNPWVWCLSYKTVQP